MNVSPFNSCRFSATILVRYSRVVHLGCGDPQVARTWINPRWVAREPRSFGCRRWPWTTWRRRRGQQKQPGRCHVFWDDMMFLWWLVSRKFMRNVMKIHVFFFLKSISAQLKQLPVQELLPQVLRNLTKVPLGSYSGTYKGVEYRCLALCWSPAKLVWLETAETADVCGVEFGECKTSICDLCILHRSVIERLMTDGKHTLSLHSWS